jgi:hypothetical protein
MKLYETSYETSYEKSVGGRTPQISHGASM